MRLALLKQNACQCNNAVREKHPGSHTSEEMVISPHLIVNIEDALVLIQILFLITSTL